MNSQSLYPDFDVMREVEAWDDHTREIVKKRLEPVTSFQFLKRNEAELLTEIAATLINDDREDILSFIVKHFDGTLQSKIGESQRKVGIPPEADLVRKGLTAIEATARSKFGGSFSQLTLIQCETLLGQVERGELPGTGPWTGLPQKELFKKLLNLTVEAYYSYPLVWSEIGYAGPAYPRGYIRTELDLADPWEPKLETGSADRKE